MDQRLLPLSEAGCAKMIERSAELLMNPIGFGEPGFDKIFIAGKVSQKGNHWRLDVMDDYPVVALDDAVREEFGLVNCPTVKELRQQKIGELSLVSGGSFVWLKQGRSRSLILLKRDELASTDAGLMTGPAGRCDKAMSATITEETNEELILIKSGSFGEEEYCRLLGFRWDGAVDGDQTHWMRDLDGSKVPSFKLRQITNKCRVLAAKSKYLDCALLHLIRGPEDVEIASIKPVVSDIQSDSLSFFVAGKRIDRVDNCLAYFDTENNTLEIRVVFEINLSEKEGVVGIWDGEGFCREVVLVDSLDEVPEALAVPALKNYKRKAASMVKLE